MSILNLSQYATEDVGTECDTGKTKITCYYAASFEHDLTRLNGLTIKGCLFAKILREANIFFHGFNGHPWLGGFKSVTILLHLPIFC